MLGIVLQTMELKFKNYQLVKWCEDNEITFTRGRSYKKNDNCFVEQKNNSVVRHLVGYYRYEGQEALETLEKLYKLWCLLVSTIIYTTFLMFLVLVTLHIDNNLLKT